MIPVRTIPLVLWIVCLSVPAWADVRTVEDPSLGVSSTGKFTIAGTETFLLGISYFDGLRYRTSDIDILAARGFNNLRVFTDFDDDDLQPGLTSVCNANGSIRSAEAATINALIDYAETKTMTVTLVVLNAHSDSWMTTDTARLNCVTNTVKVFKTQPLVMFDIVQEHGEPTWSDTAPELKVYTDTARAACAACILYASGGYPAMAPDDATSHLTSTHKAQINAEVVTNGSNVLAIHETRSSNWWSVTGARVAEYRDYLASIGKQNIPVIFDEPNRWGANNNSTETEFNTAAAAAKAAGAAIWVFHHGASFDMSESSLFAQLNATETAITLSMAAALSSPVAPPCK